MPEQVGGSSSSMGPMPGIASDDIKAGGVDPTPGTVPKLALTTREKALARLLDEYKCLNDQARTGSLRKSKERFYYLVSRNAEKLTEP